MAQKLKTALIILGSLLALSGIFLPVLASADDCASLASGSSSTDATTCTCPSTTDSAGKPIKTDHPLDANGNPIANCADDKQPGDCQPEVSSSNSTGIDPKDPTKCADVSNACVNESQSDCLASDPIVSDLNLIVNFLSIGVGVVVTAVIIVGGIQYSIAGDNPSAVAAARKRIINGLIALVAFLLTYGFLQWLIPGGVFG